MRDEIRTEVISALRPEKGGVYLDRVINRFGALDFRGEVGAEAWELAVRAGNWIAAAILAKGGYEPPGEAELAQYLIRHRLDACDFNGQPAAHRLWGLFHNLSNSDTHQCGMVAFALRMGGPWESFDLNVALFLAADFKKGSPLIRLLCEAGADVNCRLDEVQAMLPGRAGMSDSAGIVAQWRHPGATPLIVAASRPMGGRVEPWLECGADPLAADAEGRTALHWCCMQGNAEGARLLLARNAGEVDRPDSKGERPIHAALRARTGALLDALLAAGARPPEPDYDLEGCHAGALLRLAAREGVPLPSTRDGAEKLLATLPGTRARHADLLRSALEGQYWELVKVLLTAGAEATGDSLHTAAGNGDADAVALLVAAGAAVNEADRAGNTPLILACRAGDAGERALQALLAAGADPKLAGDSGMTCLHALALSPDDASTTAQLLIKAGASVDATHRDGDTPLHDALRANKVELARTLIRGKAKVNQATGSGVHALGLCVSAQAAELLLTAMGRIEAGNPVVAEAVLRQAAYGADEVFAAVLRALPKPAAVCNESGETLLHRVAWSDQSEDAARLQMVMERCKNVEAGDQERKTPLMVAARFGTERAVELLLAAGASGSKADAKGLTAADHAREKGRWKLSELLAKAANCLMLS